MENGRTLAVAPMIIVTVRTTVSELEHPHDEHPVLLVTVAV